MELLKMTIMASGGETRMRTYVFLLVLVLVLTLGLSACGSISEAEEHFSAGVQLQDQERWEEAIAEYDEAIRLDSEFFEAYNNRAYVHFKLDQFERAIQDYDEAIRLDPRNPMVYATRGITYRLAGKIDEAIADLEKVISLTDDPEQAEAAKSLIAQLSK